MSNEVLHAFECDCQEYLDKWKALTHSLKTYVESIGHRFINEVECGKTWEKIDEQDD